MENDAVGWISRNLGLEIETVPGMGHLQYRVPASGKLPARDFRWKARAEAEAKIRHVLTDTMQQMFDEGVAPAHVSATEVSGLPHDGSGERRFVVHCEPVTVHLGFTKLGDLVDVETVIAKIDDPTQWD